MRDKAIPIWTFDRVKNCIIELEWGQFGSVGVSWGDTLPAAPEEQH